MKRIITAMAAVALTELSPANATTFPTLTQIYVASGANDTSTLPQSGVATVVSCTNMSGEIASVRYQFRRVDGVPLAGATLLLANLATKTIATEGNVAFLAETPLPTGAFSGGSLQILSTQSAIFCSASLVNADGPNSVSGVELNMVRFNPHPGTVE